MSEDLDEIRKKHSNSIQYFWNEKRNLERYSDWEEVKHAFPEIARAWNDYRYQSNILDTLVDNLETY